MGLFLLKYSIEIPDSSVVERSAVNRLVIGSSPIQGDIGASPSGKAAGFGSAIRRFDPFRPRFFFNKVFVVKLVFRFILFIKQYKTEN